MSDQPKVHIVNLTNIILTHKLHALSDALETSAQDFKTLGP